MLQKKDVYSKLTHVNALCGKEESEFYQILCMSPLMGKFFEAPLLIQHKFSLNKRRAKTQGEVGPCQFSPSESGYPLQTRRIIGLFKFGQQLCRDRDEKRMYYIHQANVVMQRLSNPMETLLNNKITRKRIVLSFKDSPRKADRPTKKQSKCAFKQTYYRSRARIRSLEENVTEERQRGLPCLPAHDPRFPQPPIYLAPKSSSDRNRRQDLLPALLHSLYSVAHLVKEHCLMTSN